MPRGLKLEKPRICFRWLPSLRIFISAKLPWSSSRKTMYLPSGEYEPANALTAGSWEWIR
jgi:hypothetical protein